jgi:hypothetical protein
MIFAGGGTMRVSIGMSESSAAATAVVENEAGRHTIKYNIMDLFIIFVNDRSGANLSMGCQSPATPDLWR